MWLYGTVMSRIAISSIWSTLERGLKETHAHAPSFELAPAPPPLRQLTFQLPCSLLLFLLSVRQIRADGRAEVEPILLRGPRVWVSFITWYSFYVYKWSPYQTLLLKTFHFTQFYTLRIVLCCLHLFMIEEKLRLSYLILSFGETCTDFEI